MKMKCIILASIVSAALIEPVHAENWLYLCITAGSGASVPITEVQTRRELAPLRSGDLVYQLMGKQEGPTLAFRGNKLVPIVPAMDALTEKGLVTCSDEPKSNDYPIIAQNTASDGQLIYDEFGFVSDFFPLRGMKLGQHTRCPVNRSLFVSEAKLRELRSKGISLLRFCAAMSDNSWFWFDPETGQRRAEFQLILDGQLGPQFFFKPISCFLNDKTLVDPRTKEIRPKGCVFRYNPLTGASLSEEEGQALAQIAVFTFGEPERGGTLDDTEGLAKQSARRLSAIKINIIKGQ